MSQPGGVESVVRELLPRLRERRPQWRIENVWAYATSTRVNKIPLLGDLVAALVLAWKSRRYDVVVVNGAEYAWPQLARRRNIIVVWHGTREHEAPTLRPKMSLGLAAYRAAESFLQRLSAHSPMHLVVGERVASEVRAALGEAAAIVLALNGSPSVLRSTQARVRGRILWIGTTRYQKGYDRLLDVMRKLRASIPSAHVRVAGLPPSGDEPGGVEHLGRLSTAEMASEYASAEVVYVTSRYEGCSMTVLEAMAYGTPVVGSEAVSWMLPARSQQRDDVERLRALLDDPGERETTVAEQEQVRRRFDWTRTTEVYLAEITARQTA